MCEYIYSDILNTASSLKERSDRPSWKLNLDDTQRLRQGCSVSGLLQPKLQPNRYSRTLMTCQLPCFYSNFAEIFGK
jgi:hypothetical protein